MARVRVADGVVAQVSQKIGQPLALDPAEFNRHYATRLALPFPVLKNLDAAQIARFQENFSGTLGADWSCSPCAAIRSATRRRICSATCGATTIRRKARTRSSTIACRIIAARSAWNAVSTTQLRGRAGAESLLVNSQGYRQSENIWSQPEPGQNVVLTIDLDLQRAAEESIASHQAGAWRGRARGGGGDGRAQRRRAGDGVIAHDQPALFQRRPAAGRNAARSGTARGREIAPGNQPRDAGKLRARLHLQGRHRAGGAGSGLEPGKILHRAGRPDAAGQRLCLDWPAQD